MAGSVGILGIAIPVVCLILPSILVAYNKILTKRPIEAEISILRVTFWKNGNKEQVPSGTYFCQIEAVDYIETWKMVISK